MLTSCPCLTALQSPLATSLLKCYAFCKERASPVCGYGRSPKPAAYFGTSDEALSLVVLPSSHLRPGVLTSPCALWGYHGTETPKDPGSWMLYSVSPKMEMTHVCVRKGMCRHTGALATEFWAVRQRSGPAAPRTRADVRQAAGDRGRRRAGPAA